MSAIEELVRRIRAVEKDIERLLTVEGGGGGGGLGGSTGATDNAALRANGTGGATVQNSLAIIDDAGTINIPTGQTYNINNSPHAHAGAVARSGATTDAHLAIWNGSDADSIKDGGAVPGGIGGSSGSTDNAIIRADGTGGATVQNSLAVIDDAGTINIPTGQTYNINNSPHAHAGAVARSGATTDAHLAIWNGSDADSIKDGGAVPSGGFVDFLVAQVFS